MSDAAGLVERGLGRAVRAIWPKRAHLVAPDHLRWAELLGE